MSTPILETVISMINPINIRAEPRRHVGYMTHNNPAITLINKEACWFPQMASNLTCTFENTCTLFGKLNIFSDRATFELT